MIKETWFLCNIFRFTENHCAWLSYVLNQPFFSQIVFGIASAQLTLFSLLWSLRPGLVRPNFRQVCEIQEKVCKCAKKYQYSKCLKSGSLKFKLVWDPYCIRFSDTFWPKMCLKTEIFWNRTVFVFFHLSFSSYTLAPLCWGLTCIKSLLGLGIDVALPAILSCAGVL